MEPIAIIGFAFKLPQGAKDSESLWEILEEGRNVMTDWPESRINLDSFYDANPRNQNSLKARGGHFLDEDPGVFDAPFFSITAKEAAAMDPQQRFMLETSYLALENAGIPLDQVSGSQTAVYEASMADDYSQILFKDGDNMPRTTATGTAHAILANRVSWFFNFLGPSIHIDTACSGSMVAIDLACGSLCNGDSSMALVAGSNLILSPEASLMLSRMNFLSPDSVCHSFDHRANGYARGEGTIVVVLKRLSDAISNGDTIRAVIRSTATNQDGHTPGLTQPSALSQEQLIRRVYEKAGLDFGLTRYIEAHGTGTPVGDPLEMQAIGRVFRTSRTPEEPLYVGSIKANIGHLEGGSGLAGVLKSILMLEKGVLPPNALFEKVNPQLDTEFYNIKVPTELMRWPSEGLRRISVNSFGFGGTNAHIILDDAFHYLRAHNLAGNHCTSSIPHNRFTNPTPEDLVNGDTMIRLHREKAAPNGTQDHEHTNGTGLISGAYKHIEANGFRDLGSLNGACENRITNGLHGLSITNGFRAPHTNGVLEPCTNGDAPNGPRSAVEGPQLLVWSAADENALNRTVQSYLPYYRQRISEDPSKLKKLAFTLSARRTAMLWRSFAIVNPVYSDPEADLSVSKPHRSSQTGLAFVFTGQGAEYVRMGVELLQYRVFSDTLQQFDDVLAKLGCPWSLLEKLEGSESLSRPQYSQPICTALQIALVELLKSLGIAPNAVVGHSSGEIAAAYSIGALSLESACKVAYYRGLLAEKLSRISPIRGSMISANLSSDDVPGYLERRIEDATIRSNVAIACINSPRNVTLSGDESTIDLLKDKLDEDNIFAHKLKTGMAYHSPAMKAIASEYMELMGELTRAATGYRSIPMISTVTGKPVAPKLVSRAHYWVSNLVSPVRFVDAMQSILDASSKVQLGLPRMRPVYDLVEVGPHSALRRPCMDIIERNPRKAEVRYTSVLSRNESSATALLKLIGTLFTYGYAVSATAANNQGDASKPGASFLVDTPQYPFDRSQRYWHETRMSYDYRMRGQVPRDVLGARAQDWNPLEPKWRKIISTEELPWVHDHVVSGSCIYPATGMLVMAIEAVKQTVPENKIVKGFLIKDAEFKSPITLRSGPDDESRVETVINLRPIRKPYEKESKWFEIWISTYHEQTWTECFRCTIQVQLNEPQTQVDGGKELMLAHGDALAAYGNASASCKRPLQSRTFYKYCSDRGITYGPSFSILENIRCQDGYTAVGEVDVSLPTAEYEGLVHPAIIDAACQVCWLAPTRGLTDQIPTEVPHRLRDTYITASGWKSPQTSRVRIASTARFKEGGKGVEGSVIVLADDGSLLCKVGRLELSPVADDSQHRGLDRKLLHGIQWKPCLSMLRPSEIATACEAERFTGDEYAMIEYDQKLTMALCLVIEEALAQVSEHDRRMAPPHLEKYISWMGRVQQERSASTKELRNSEPPLDQLLAEVEALKPDWTLYISVARNLLAIVRGDVDPLELIFSTDLAERFYADIFHSMCDHRFRTFLELASHENPNLAILEVGAGTGGFTSHVLSALGDLEQCNGGTRFSRYMYTDVSHAFFENARVKFRQFENRMEFKALDLERDISKQGFEEGAYDMVVAGSVLHTTKSLSSTLQNLQKALKPGGKLLFFEITGPNAFALQFGFGTLPGWWRGTETWRLGDHDQVTTEWQWDGLLKQNGFSGNDLVLRDYPNDACHSWSIMASTTTTTPEELTSKSRIVLCYDHSSTAQENLAHAIRDRFSQSGSYLFEVADLGSISSINIVPEDYVIFLCEVGRSLLEGLTKGGFETLQYLMTRVRNVLWLISADIADSGYPFAGMTTGFLRTMRSESSNSRIITLALEGNERDVDAHAQHIESVFRHSFELSSLEMEYVVRNGQLAVGRLVEEKTMNNDVLSAVYPSLEMQPWSEGPPVMFDVGTPGTLDSLRFVEDPVYQQHLGADEIEIEARACGLNFRDVFIALGRLEENEFGLDTAGYVTRVGSNCLAMKPGDRVIMVRCGSMRQLPRSHYLEAIPIPDAMTFEDAVSLLAPAMTAYHSLVKIARLQRGERVLIHSAAGATGQLAIQIAQMIGAEIFATVGNLEKKQLLMSLGIDEDHIFYSRDTTFAQGVKRKTKGYGVDVVLNSLSGDGLVASWECIAPFGRFIEIGKADIKANSSLPMACFEKNAAFFAVDLRHIFASRKETVQDLLNCTMGLWANGDIQYPHPRHVYSVSVIEEAFRFLQSGKNTGRIVINSKPSDVVPKFLTTHRAWCFKENASYLIAGGLGGIGRGISRWMMRKGVKSLILPSRSGPKTEAAIELVEDLRRNGVTVVAPICDVSSIESLSKLLEDCARTMPPIKGCINAAMTLQDAIFDNMTFEQWETAVRSKVQTSWNLHTLLPRSLDFFILLSSLAGIFGNVSQSNYAAGNTFQDALARYRTAHGQKALSINLGWMRTIGIISEKEEYENFRMAGADMAQIEEHELMCLLDHHCDPSQAVTDPLRSQILMGTVTPADLQAEGIKVPDVMRRPLFSSFSMSTSAARMMQDEAEDSATLFRHAGTEVERAEVVVKALSQKLARSLSMPADDIDPSKPLFEYGVDSLVAVELRNWIGKEFRADVAVFDIMGGATIAAVGALVAKKSAVEKK